MRAPSVSHSASSCARRSASGKVAEVAEDDVAGDEEAAVRATLFESIRFRRLLGFQRSSKHSRRAAVREGRASVGTTAGQQELG